jgi:hypothetical protein
MDVQHNITLGVFSFEEQKLSDDQVRHVIVNGSPEKNNSLL